MHRRAVLQSGLGAAALAGAAWAEAPGLSAADRLEIQDLLSRALWATDTGDAESLAGTTTLSASIQDEHGRSWSPRAYAAHLAGAGHRPGMLHEAQVNRVRSAGGKVIVESYWSAMSWPEGAPDPGLEDLAICTDTCVQEAGRWRIAERRIRPWNSATVHVTGAGRK
jgi:hypothetical protein